MNKSVKIFEFTIMHIDWEMDNKGWVEKTDQGDLRLMTTNHGTEYELLKLEGPLLREMLQIFQFQDPV